MTSVDAGDGPVEQDPSGRFHRYKTVLGRGSFKTVYMAFDNQEALEVAWNKLNVERLSQDLRNKLENEVIFLRKLDHQNIIKLYDSFKSSGPDGIESLDFITELMMSGTLKDYLKKAKVVKLKVIRRWCANILAAIAYLHKKGIMHRDLKLENLFVNGHVGEVKIGDLGLSAVIAAEKAESVIGTPEYMAPELYEESYTEKVDIYAFGMCLLEMVSMDYPYSECKGPAQIMKKAINSEKPAAFFKLVDSDVKDVVEQCLKREPERPSAEELQRHPLFRDWNSDDGTRSNLSLVIGTAESAKENPSLELAASGDLAVGEKVIAFSEKLNRDVYVAMEGHSNSADAGNSEPGVVVEQASEGPAFRIGITIPIQDLGVKLIEFTISPNDEPRVVAGEMVTEFGLDPQMVPELTDEIEKQLASLRELRERDQHVHFRSPGPTASLVTTSHANRAVERSLSDPVTSNSDPLTVDERGSLAEPLPSRGASSNPILDPMVAPMSHEAKQGAPVRQQLGQVNTPQMAGTLVHPPVSVASAEPVPQQLFKSSQPDPVNPSLTTRPTAFTQPALLSQPEMFLPVPSRQEDLAPGAVQNISSPSFGLAHEDGNDLHPTRGTLGNHAKTDYVALAQTSKHQVEATVVSNSDMQVLQNRQNDVQADQTVREINSTIPAPPTGTFDISIAKVLTTHPSNMPQVRTEGLLDIKTEQSSHGSVIDLKPSRGVASRTALPPLSMSTSALPAEQSGLDTMVQPPLRPRLLKMSPAEGTVVHRPEIGNSAVLVQLPPIRDGSEKSSDQTRTVGSVPLTKADTHMNQGADTTGISPHPLLPPSLTPVDSLAPVDSSERQPETFQDRLRMQPTAFAALPPPLPHEGGVTAAPPKVSFSSIMVQRTPSNSSSARPSSSQGTSAQQVRPIVVVGGDKVPAGKPLSQPVASKKESSQSTVHEFGGNSSSAHVIGAAALADAHGSRQSVPRVPLSTVVPGPDSGIPKPSPAIDLRDVSRPSGHIHEVHGRENAAVGLSSVAPPLSVNGSRPTDRETGDAVVVGALGAGQSSTPVTSVNVPLGGGPASSSILMQASLNARSSSQKSIYSDDSVSQASNTLSPAQSTPALPGQSSGLPENEADQQRFYLLCLELMDNVAKGRVALVKQKLSQGASVTFADYDKRTPLHLAALYGDTAVCKLLLEHGADVNALDRWNRTPLQDARIHSHAEVVDILLQAGANDNEDAEDLSGIKMLQACANGQLDTVRELIASNTPVTYKDYESRTALHVACSQGHADIVDLLLLNGANPLAADGRNRTPVDNAVRNGHRNVLEVLKRNGVEKNSLQAPVSDRTQTSVSPKPAIHSVWSKSGSVSSDVTHARAAPEGLLNGHGHSASFTTRPKSTPPTDYLAEELDSMKSAVAISHSVSMGNIVIGSDGFALPTGGTTGSGRDGFTGSNDSLSHSHLSSQSLPASRFDTSDLEGELSVGDEKVRLLVEWQERRKQLDEEVQMKLDMLQPPKGEASSLNEWQERRKRLDEEVQIKLDLLQPRKVDTASGSGSSDSLPARSLLSVDRGDVRCNTGLTEALSFGAHVPSASEELSALLPRRVLDSALGSTDGTKSAALACNDSGGSVVILPVSSSIGQANLPEPVYSSEGTQIEEKITLPTPKAVTVPASSSHNHKSGDADFNASNVSEIDLGGSSTKLADKGSDLDVGVEQRSGPSSGQVVPIDGVSSSVSATVASKKSSPHVREQEH